MTDSEFCNASKRTKEHVPPTVYGPTPADPDELEREANELIAEIQKAVDERKCTPVTTSEPQSGKRVFDSAVALAEYWDGLHELFREFLRAESPELCTLLSANSAAVKGAVSDD